MIEAFFPFTLLPFVAFGANSIYLLTVTCLETLGRPECARIKQDVQCQVESEGFRTSFARRDKHNEKNEKADKEDSSESKFNNNAGYVFFVLMKSEFDVLSNVDELMNIAGLLYMPKLS
ncbi:hypothetical protein M0804_004070 [Polistes exclamans]|nr:hypothetical protein M0804_004070 [Polistes exclamans]